MRNLSASERWKMAETLSRSSDLSKDPVYPLMVWYGIEQLVKNEPARALQLAKNSKLETIREWIPRRLAE